MKSFFASKRYDLCAAQRVHSWNNGREVTDSAYRAISLYHTPEGGWLFHHTEGPMTGSGTSSVEIVPVSRAMLWPSLPNTASRSR
jgi:hypothetical protein